MAAPKNTTGEINAAPTKSFFVDMLVRDIPLEQAVLDLVDNSIDGAKRQEKKSFEGFKVDISISAEQFRILDNCGGFDKSTAKNYAFRFGRPADTPVTSNSIGQFGVGMKRALFKFGRHFIVRSATTEEKWAVEVPVTEWESNADDWHFRWAEFGNNTEISMQKPGTDIVVTQLRQEVSARFGTQLFVNSIIALIKSKHRQFIGSGLQVTVNGTHLDATNLFLSESRMMRPGVDTLTFGREYPLKARIVVGVGTSSPKEAGWYVICNGRVIVEADRRSTFGWGLVEESQNRIVMPSYHNQYARFRGIVSFDAKESSVLPWNTTKTDVDQDHPVWPPTFQRMIEMMRPVIDFLNELDADIDAFKKEEAKGDSPLLSVVSKASLVRSDSLTKKMEFQAPARSSLPKKKVPQEERISYTRMKKDITLLQRELGVESAKAVGEKTFDLILGRHKK